MLRKAQSTASDSGLHECLENKLFMMVERSTISRATSCRLRAIEDEIYAGTAPF